MNKSVNVLIVLLLFISFSFIGDPGLYLENAVVSAVFADEKIGYEPVDPNSWTSDSEDCQPLENRAATSIIVEKYDHLPDADEIPETKSDDRPQKSFSDDLTLGLMICLFLLSIGQFFLKFDDHKQQPNVFSMSGFLMLSLCLLMVFVTFARFWPLAMLVAAGSLFIRPKK